MYGDFEDWLDDKLFPKLVFKESNPAGDVSLDIKISTNARATNWRQDVSTAIVKDNQLLTTPGEPQKWHVELELPKSGSNGCGDYLAVLPLNTEQSVKRVMAHFKLPWDAVLTLNSSVPSTIPTNTPLSVHDVLRSYVELAQPATKEDIKLCLQHTSSQASMTYLSKLLTDISFFESQILDARASVLDMLFTHKYIDLPFSTFLSLLPPLHACQYSISASPLPNASIVSITYAVISGVAHADPDTAFHGVAGTYLSSLTAGDSIQVSIRPTANSRFRLPKDPAKEPLLMFAAGTGIAPFRGFIQ